MQPTHPYALYQQTTFEEPEDIEEAPTQHIPIGFIGRPNTYRRTTGPDGEELEVIGPDGHMEQLPPYSRYPDAGPLPQKAAMVNSSPVSSLGEFGGEASNSMAPATAVTAATAATAATVATAASPVIPLTPATSATSASAAVSPILPSVTGTPRMTSNAQHFGSNHQLQAQPSTSPQSQTAAPADTSFANDARAIQSSSSSLAEEKRRGSGRWSLVRRKRVLCGVIPLWVVMLVIVLLLFLAIIAGGVLGGLLTQQREKKHRLVKYY
jgi:hypothetical protein